MAEVKSDVIAGCEEGGMQRWLWQLWLIITLCFGNSGIFVSRVVAQITPDNTLGGENSVVTPLNPNENLIEGGAARGSNLFHSFQEFSIPEGNSAFFANPVVIQNIFSRVTGGNPSEILGKLGVLGEANLFFINPNGIIFGKNASLDLKGSFVGSTANSFSFPDGSQFSATNPQAPPLLKIEVEVPVGLVFAEESGANIVNEGNLIVEKNLTLAADNLYLEGQLIAGENLTLQANDTTQIRDSASQAFIAASGKDLLVQGNKLVDIFALNHPDSGLYSFGDMILRSSTSVGGDAHYYSGGNFRIEQLDENLGDLFSPHDPLIRSQGNVSFHSYVGTSLHILAGGQVNIGQITIAGGAIDTERIDFIREDITLSNGTVLSIDGQARPTLDIRAGVAPFQVGIPGITPDNTGFFRLKNIPGLGTVPVPDNPIIVPIATSADLNIGVILMSGDNIPDGDIFLTNQYQPNSSLSGGNIKVGVIFAAEEISNLQGLDDLFRNLGNVDIQRFSGNGANVIIDSREKIIVTQGSLNNLGLDIGLIFTASASPNRGDINLIANQDIILNNSFIVSDAVGTDKGGDINVKAESISLTGSQILTFTSGTLRGDGGDINIDTSNSVNIINGGGFGANTAGDGKGGDITINTPQLIIQNNQPDIINDTGITTSANTPNTNGQGGNVIINAETIHIKGNEPGSFNPNLNPTTINELDNIRVGIATTTLSDGDAGDLTINTKELTISDGAGISTSVRPPSLGNTGGGGNAGILSINTTQINLVGKGGIVTNTLGTGDANNLNIDAEQITLSNGAIISAGTVSSGDGANVEINANQIRILSGSRIGAATLGIGNGGDVIINTNFLEILNGAGIFTDTFGNGKAGDIIVNISDEIELNNSEISAKTTGEGTAGSIQINQNQTPVNNILLEAGKITVEATETGDAGSIQLNITNLTANNNSQISASTNSGRGGDIKLENLENLTVTNSEISASTIDAKAGNINIDASQSVELTGERGLAVAATGKGESGVLTVNTPSLTLNNNAQISASVVDGKNSNNQITNIEITANNLTLENSSQISSSTAGSRQAGNIKLNIAEEIILSGTDTGIFASTSPNSTGDGGSIELISNILFLNSGSQIAASTAGAGNGGNIKLTVAQDIILSGINTGIFANTEIGSTGDSGRINIDPELVLIENGAAIAVNSQGTGIGGDIELIANILNLNQGTISAQTLSNTGGNITLNLQELLFRENLSQISTTAGNEQFGGDGGNIFIDVPFIIAFPLENSDITANAFLGNGGRSRPLTPKHYLGLNSVRILLPLVTLLLVQNLDYKGKFRLILLGLILLKGWIIYQKKRLRQILASVVKQEDKEMLLFTKLDLVVYP